MFQIDDFKIKDYSTSSTPYISSPGQKDDLTHHPGITTNASNFYQTYCEPYPYDPRLEHTTKETYLDKKKYLHQSKYQNKYEDNDYPVMDIEFVVNMEKDQNELDLNNKLKFDKERRGILEKVLYHQQLLDVDRQCKIEKKNMDKLSKATERILRGGRGDGEAHRRHRRTRHRSRS